MFKGYKEVVFNDDQMAQFYQGDVKIDLDMFENEYLVIKDEGGDIKDVRKFKNGDYKNLTYKHFKQNAIPDGYKPKDVYQKMLVDSLITDQFTAISGGAGSGKSLWSLLYILSQLEQGKASKCVILFNPVKTRGVSDMGFYSGSFEEKALQQSVGNMISAKMGKLTLTNMMSRETIQLVSMADARGMEIKSDEILYVTEAQNTNSDIMGLCLSRVEEGAKVIIEGDYKAQVDNRAYANKCNGLIAAIELFSGKDMFSHVELQNVYRSRIAEIAQQLIHGEHHD